jgi:hypothetical protein
MAAGFGISPQELVAIRIVVGIETGESDGPRTFPLSDSRSLSLVRQNPYWSTSNDSVPVECPESARLVDEAGSVLDADKGNREIHEPAREDICVFLVQGRCSMFHVTQNFGWKRSVEASSYPSKERIASEVTANCSCVFELHAKAFDGNRRLFASFVVEKITIVSSHERPHERLKLLGHSQHAM